MNTTLTVRVSPSQAERLDELARAAGVSRSQLLRRLVDEATVGAAPAARRLTEDEAVDLLHEQARAGRVAAISEVLRRARDEDPFARGLRELEEALGADGG